MMMVMMMAIMMAMMMAKATKPTIYCLQVAGATALHLLSQPDARHGHHPVQGLQQGDDGGRDYEDETPLKKTNEVLHF